jgi:hypothetical protein
MADTPNLVSSMGRAVLDRIFVRGHDLNRELLGKITFDHGMTTGAAASRMTSHSAPDAIQGAVAAAILGAGSVYRRLMPGLPVRVRGFCCFMATYIGAGLKPTPTPIPAGNLRMILASLNR